MATSTTIINAQTVYNNGGFGKYPSKTTLSATTTALTVSCTLTNGNSAGNPTCTIRVFFATSPVSITAAAAVEQLKQAAAYFDIKPHASPNGITIQDFPLMPRKGDYAYCWIEDPKGDGQTGTLTAILYELN